MTRTRPVYSPHPGFAMEASSIARLKEKTGKTLEEWIAIIKKSGPPSTKERREWLKEKHGFSTNYAMFVADRAAGKGGIEHYDPGALVDQIFSGRKAHLWPLYEEILHFGLSLGEDVKVSPCATIIPFYRNHVFAQVKAPNRSRIDLGFALGGLNATDTLIDTGGFAKKDRITHRVEIAAPHDFNDEARRWFRRAYERDGA